jgi:short-subunit dehydrogenase
MEKDEQNGMDPADVAKAIVAQVVNKHVHTFYVTGLQYQLIYHLFNILPTDLRLWIIGKLYA